MTRIRPCQYKVQPHTRIIPGLARIAPIRCALSPTHAAPRPNTALPRSRVARRGTNSHQSVYLFYAKHAQVQRIHALAHQRRRVSYRAWPALPQSDALCRQHMQRRARIWRCPGHASRAGAQAAVKAYIYFMPNMLRSSEFTLLPISAAAYLPDSAWRITRSTSSSVTAFMRLMT